MKPQTGSIGNLLPFFRQEATIKNSRSEYTDHPFNTPNQDDKTSTLYIVIGYLLLILLLSLSQVINSYAQTSQSIRGRITDEKGEPLTGALIKIKGTSTGTSTGKNGEFALQHVPSGATLLISFIGYKTLEIQTQAIRPDQPIILQPDATQLEQVEVVSTGYQQIPKERATGSFVLLDSALINRRVSTNILDRLDGVTSGLIFNRNKTGNTPDISIRGRSTIQGNPDPLIILDNFPYDGDLENINPQDVESISVLKDAAAASIWGTRAGNGVIVITTKKGKLNQKPRLSFNSNVTIGQKPDLWYQPQLSNKEFIEVEQFLFDKGRFNSIINNKYGALSPAVEIMLMRRNNQITDTQRDAMLDSIAQYDNRTDLDKYFYRNSVNQQYQFSVNGGGQFNKYYVSLGYDNNLSSSVGQGNDRLTLNANNTTSLFNGKAELLTGVIFTMANNKSDSEPYTPLFPYERLAGDDGNALAVIDRSRTLRLPYIDTAGAGRLLDWHYRPLDELRNKYSASQNKLTDYRFNTALTWHIVNGLNVSGNYTYQKGVTDVVSDYSTDSYYTRNQINQVSRINPTTGAIIRPVPLGDIVRNINSSYYSHYGRGQLNFDHLFQGNHQINALAGYEIKDYRSDQAGTMLYGYDPKTATNLNSTVNYTADNPNYYGSGTTKISPGTSNYWSVDRYRSYYANASYIYNSRYVVSGSARKDESNLFGVGSNQKGVSLWSAGLAWNLSNENFYSLPVLPYLKLRFTYGYNGNVDKSTSAYLTAVTAVSPNLWNVPFLNVQNPPNPSLRWEKIENINWGIDFATKSNRISGSADFWIKNGKDLIGKSPIAPQSGVIIFTGNSADMKGSGLDISLNTVNLRMQDFIWRSNFLFNYNTDKIVKYKAKQGSNSSIVSGNYENPLEGYSYYSIFAFRYNGLDALGNPVGVLNNEPSENYSAITASLNPGDITYMGTLTPKLYGNVCNAVSWKDIELSFNITYKFNYYFRRQSLNNGSLYSLSPSYLQPDYAKRWQKPGDELSTSVPSLIYPVNSSRDLVYTNSEVLVEKSDHIRLQDVRLGYTIKRNKSSVPTFSAIQLYVYASNLGVLWKSTKYKTDPDNPNGIPAAKLFSFGLKADF